ncbi:MAG TPA: hypothetical protein VFH92_00350 [Phenylobacterium sp.]|nr:hypothetical protein [Phenylobacterium sp.]
MDEAARLITLLALAGGALSLLGAAFAWFLDEVRRIRRTLRQALGAEPQPWLAARGRGVGIAFNLAAGELAVTWDRGGWRLNYMLAELVGVELIVDRRVAARAFRGEARRPLDQLDEPQERVRLRFVFDDPEHPDFELDLWRPEDDGRRGRMTSEAALHEANRWVARIEALLRRNPARPQPAAIPVAAPSPPLRPAAAPPVAGSPFEDDDEIADDAEDAIT